VILPDVNLLLYAADRGAPQHKAARAWLEAALSSGLEIRLAWVVILAFLRISTRQGWSRQPASIDSALAVVESWLNHPSVAIAHPGPEHVRILRRLLNATGTAGNLTTDATRRARHGIRRELASADNDFARFPGLRWQNPLHSPLK